MGALHGDLGRGGIPVGALVVSARFLVVGDLHSRFVGVRPAWRTCIGLWIPQSTSRLAWLFATAACAFLSLLFYELWLGGFILYLALHFYLSQIQRANARRPLFSAALYSFKKCWYLLLPYLVWLVWFKLSAGRVVHQPTFSPARLLRTCLSIHFRVYHWLTDVPWIAGCREGIKFLVSPVGLTLAILSVGAAILVVRIIPLARKARTGEPPMRPPLFESMLLAWGVFLASRAVLVFAGGVSTDTRKNYGAAMGVAMAAAFLLAWLNQRFIGKRAVLRTINVLAATALVVMGLASTGIAVHYRETSRFEQITYERLLPLAKAMSADTTVVVIGNPTRIRGELAYYSECDGLWLNDRLKKQAPGILAYVVPHAKLSPEGVELSVRRDRSVQEGALKQLLIPWQKAVVLRWQGQELKRLVGVDHNTNSNRL